MRARAVLLEIAVQDSAGARVALASGADRLELCQALEVGGLTPSIGVVESAFDAVDPRRVAVLVRPRPGGFVYDADEVDAVARDIRAVVSRGAGSVVVGALTPEGGADAEALRRWSDAAEHAEIVFHRAIDTLGDPVALIDDLADLGVRRVLSSGGAARSIDGTGSLARMVERAAGRLEIMAGGGVRVEDIPALISTGVDAVHLSARRRAGDSGGGPGGGGAVGYDVTDAATVVAASDALGAWA
ncbi:copper homeostasis protein CutC [Microbacterium sp. NIBRBAC000506063]|uniref:copper homeostasis protein CutC n=1 Tax=Microbacterium sp. NIBRBAC000506063 TaxID=2734618 RepID=UPI001BB69E15|nr:copper homeostasis protein CutC [Microbacterium sp. NIBRBAC000506063]QTV79615.1 copper homeostasis protein CutC [Microbacterium sp. NIBRBAC000506063]